MCLVTLFTSVGHLGDVEGVLGGFKQGVVLGDLGSWGPPLDVPICFISIFINFLCILFYFLSLFAPLLALSLDLQNFQNIKYSCKTLI
jgi:hypothetical protein